MRSSPRQCQRALPRRVSDALDTLRTLPGAVDMALIDGFPQKSLAVLKLILPRLRDGAVVIADNVGAARGDYVDFVREPSNGFTSMRIPFKFGTEYSCTRRHEERAANGQERLR